MIMPERLDQALDRLTAALQRLQAVAAQRLADDARGGDPEGDATAAQADRARLAHDLAEALGRAETLLAANSHVAARLERAGATVDAVIAGLAVGRDAAAEPESP